MPYSTPTATSSPFAPITVSRTLTQPMLMIPPSWIFWNCDSAKCALTSVRLWCRNYLRHHSVAAGPVIRELGNKETPRFVARQNRVQHARSQAKSRNGM